MIKHRRDAEDPVVALASNGRAREALETCAEAHGPALGRFCMALLGDQGEAEEAAQEALLAAYEGLGRVEGALRPWLFGIARRQCARRLAKRSRRQHLRLVYDAELRNAEGTLPEEALLRHERARRVRLALEGLKPSAREALLLRYEAGLSHREIADIVGTNEAAARKRTSRALAALRSAYLKSASKEGTAR